MRTSRLLSVLFALSVGVSGALGGCAPETAASEAYLGGELRSGYAEMHVAYVPDRESGLTWDEMMGVRMGIEQQDLSSGGANEAAVQEWFDWHVPVGTHRVSLQFSPEAAAAGTSFYQTDPIEFGDSQIVFVLIEGEPGNLRTTVTTRDYSEGLNAGAEGVRRDFWNLSRTQPLQVWAWPEADRCTSVGEQADPGAPQLLATLGFGELVSLAGSTSEFNWIGASSDPQGPMFDYNQPCVGQYGLTIQPADVDQDSLPADTFYFVHESEDERSSALETFHTDHPGGGQAIWALRYQHLGMYESDFTGNPSAIDACLDTSIYYQCNPEELQAQRAAEAQENLSDAGI